MTRVRLGILRGIAWCIVAINVLFAGYDAFISHRAPGIGLLFLVIELANLVLATVLFVWASILGGQIPIKPRHLRTIASFFLVFALFLGLGVVFFNRFVVGLGSETNLLLLIVVLMNLVQATLLFMWAQIVEGKTR